MSHPPSQYYWGPLTSLVQLQYRCLEEEDAFPPPEELVDLPPPEELEEDAASTSPASFQQPTAATPKPATNLTSQSHPKPARVAASIRGLNLDATPFIMPGTSTILPQQTTTNKKTGKKSATSSGKQAAIRQPVAAAVANIKTVGGVDLLDHNGFPKPLLVIHQERPYIISPEDTVYTFIDASNIHYGAKDYCKTNRYAHEFESPHNPQYNIAKLLNIIHKGARQFATKIIAGSTSSIFGCYDLAWRQHGFNVKIGALDKHKKEVFIDEILHSSIAKCILDEEPATMVILTGDGNDYSGTCNFPLLVEAALGKGWKVIIWSWNYPLSPNFFDIYNTTDKKHNMLIKLLDNYAMDILNTKTKY